MYSKNVYPIKAHRLIIISSADNLFTNSLLQRFLLLTQKEKFVILLKKIPTLKFKLLKERELCSDKCAYVTDTHVRSLAHY